MAANLAAQLAALGAPSSGQSQGSSYGGGGGAPAARLPPKKRHRDGVAAAPSASIAVRVDGFFRPGNDGARRARSDVPPSAHIHPRAPLLCAAAGASFCVPPRGARCIHAMSARRVAPAAMPCRQRRVLLAWRASSVLWVRRDS
jgi:hypothetical protein